MDMQRTYLNGDTIFTNHLAWLTGVESQTGISFTLNGCALSVAEEILEMHTASDLRELEDAMGDSYIALRTFRIALIRELEARKLEVDFRGEDENYAPEFFGPGATGLILVAHVMVEIGRKGFKALERRGIQDVATLVGDLLNSISTMAPALTGRPWQCIMDDVFDVLDRRLVEGYTMQGGSAIKLEDSA